MSSLCKPEVPQPFSTDGAYERFIDEWCSPLAEGSSRKIYVVRNSEFIVKVALDEKKTVCNWIEVAAFHAFHNDINRIASIVSWSKSGKFIVMEKVDTSVEPSSSFIAPDWVTDIGSKNGGLAADGNYKLCDYAFVKSPDESYRSPFID